MDLAAAKKTDLGIDEGHILHEGMPEYERCRRLRDRVVTAENHLCMERARIITRAYKETESDHTIIRRAKAFKKILSEMSVYILDDELIVGHQASRQRSAPIFPEFAVDWVGEEIDTFETRPQDNFIVTEEVKNEFLRDILPYWKGKTVFDRLKSYIPEDVWLQRYDAGVFSVGLHEDGGGLGHCHMDYEKALQKGFNGIKEDILELKRGLTSWKKEDIEKNLFYQACLTIIEGVEIFAARYAECAAEMAEKEIDPGRREELLRIAEVCGHVPMNPARSFYEALQSLWFVQLLPQIYDNGVSISPGRFDQYMYPYYRDDIENGILTKVQAQELLDACWVKFTEPIKLYKAADAAFHAGYPMGQNLSIGGVGPDGVDAVNDLSFRCLEAHSHMLLMQPNFSARMHKRAPQNYLMAVVDAIKLGNGMPQIMNDEVWIKVLMNVGVPLKVARDYQMIGCVEPGVKNAWIRANGGYFNITKAIELALNDGVCRICNKKVGLSTGDPKEFKTFDEFYGAVEKQMHNSVGLLIQLDNLVDRVHAELAPIPFVSMLIGDCIENGKDATDGGARYNWTGTLGVGIANAGDTLAAIKKLIYDSNIISMDELITALDDDFKNKEDIRQILLNKAPKYGNDDEYVDGLAKKITDLFHDAHEGYVNYNGGPVGAGLLPVASYVAFGMATGATPDGRKAKEPLADGISPSAGLDLRGPTAVIKSVTTVDHNRCLNGVIFNQKFNSTELQTEEGKNKFASMIRTYIELDGGHVQFNIVSSEMLREAQKNPDKYKGLVVRVAGYSAFFNELATEVQDSIIERTEQTF